MIRVSIKFLKFYINSSNIFRLFYLDETIINNIIPNNCTCYNENQICDLDFDINHRNKHLLPKPIAGHNYATQIF